MASVEREGVREMAEVGDESLCDCESCARIDMEDRLDLLKCERRYMYDVVRLIDAYEKMWDDEPIDVDDRMLAVRGTQSGCAGRTPMAGCGVPERSGILADGRRDGP